MIGVVYLVFTACVPVKTDKIAHFVSGVVVHNVLYPLAVRDVRSVDPDEVFHAHLDRVHIVDHLPEALHIRRVDIDAVGRFSAEPEPAAVTFVKRTPEDGNPYAVKLFKEKSVYAKLLFYNFVILCAVREKLFPRVLSSERTAAFSYGRPSARGVCKMRRCRDDTAF